MAACEKFREQFDQYFDDELKEPRRKKLLAHLEACPACRVEFKLYQKVISSVESLEELPPPEDLTQAVMRAVGSGDPPGATALPDAPPPIPPQAHPGWAVAFGAALLMAMAIFLMPPADTHPQQARGPEQIVRVPDIEPGIEHGVVPDELTQVDSSRTLTGVQLTRQNGQVEVWPLGAGQWQDVSGMVPLAYGDRVRTGDDGLAAVEYQKESVALRLKPNSIIQLVSPQVFRVFAGNTWVKVRIKGTVFQAETPNAVASVRGTKFSVEVLPITDAYKEQGIKTLMQYLQPQMTPRSTTDLTMYSTQMGLSLMAQATGLDLWPHVQTQVKVYESRVNVVSKDREGKETGSHDVDAGFKTTVAATSMQLAMATPDRPVDEGDFTDWRSVMMVDQDLINRARARAAASGTGAATAASATLPTPPAAAGAEPVSESGPRPAGYFEDIHKNGR